MTPDTPMEKPARRREEACREEALELGLGGWADQDQRMQGQKLVTRDRWPRCGAERQHGPPLPLPIECPAFENDSEAQAPRSKAGISVTGPLGRGRGRGSGYQAAGPQLCPDWLRPCQGFLQERSSPGHTARLAQRQGQCPCPVRRGRVSLGPCGSCWVETGTLPCCAPGQPQAALLPSLPRSLAPTLAVENPSPTTAPSMRR